MARSSSVVAVLMVMAVFVGLSSAQGPSAAPAYAPSKSTIAAAPTTATPAPIAATPEGSTIAAAPATVAGGPSVSVAPESSTASNLASPPAPGSEAAEGPVGDFSGPAPAADAPSDTPVSAGAALKASAIVGVAAVAGSLLF